MGQRMTAAPPTVSRIDTRSWQRGASCWPWGEGWEGGGHSNKVGVALTMSIATWPGLPEAAATTLGATQRGVAARRRVAPLCHGGSSRGVHRGTPPPPAQQRAKSCPAGGCKPGGGRWTACRR